MGALETPRMTVEQYLAAEGIAELPSEFHDGEVLPMEGAGYWHGVIAGNLGAALSYRLKGKDCLLSVQPRVCATGRNYVYPDLAIVCGKARIIDRADTIDNPRVVFEILFPTTDNCGHGRKFKVYRNVSALADYVLVSQDEPYVEAFRKQADDTLVLSTHQGLDASFELKSLQISIPLAEVYANVTWEG